MAKKKEETVKPNFDDKTIGNVYEGLIVLDTKLDTLINILGKVADHIEKKEKGELTIG